MVLGREIRSYGTVWRLNCFGYEALSGSAENFVGPGAGPSKLRAGEGACRPHIIGPTVGRNPEGFREKSKGLGADVDICRPHTTVTDHKVFCFLIIGASR